MYIVLNMYSTEHYCMVTLQTIYAVYNAMTRGAVCATL